MSNPYEPPKSNVEINTNETGVPTSATINIRNAWIAGAITAGTTLIFAVMSSMNLTQLTNWQLSLADFLILATLTFGIYKRSRVSAGAMLAYVAATPAMNLLNVGKLAGGAAGDLVLLYILAQGLRGTIAYHRHLGTSRSDSSTHAA